MSEINADFIERYQLMYQRDPSSRVFAPLAEAYRKMGFLEEALRVCRAGVQTHPTFASGRITFSKILIDRGEYKLALEELRAATELSPDNILGHSLMAETHLRLMQPKDALRAFKMVLFLNPNDVRAQRYVQRLESLTADEFEPDVFEMKPIFDVKKDEIALPLKPLTDRSMRIAGATHSSLGGTTSETLYKQRVLERSTSLIDAFLIRNDVDRAQKTLVEAENILGRHPEIEKRKSLIRLRSHPGPDVEVESISVESSSQFHEQLAQKKKTQKARQLEGLLSRIQERRR